MFFAGPVPLMIRATSSIFVLLVVLACGPSPGTDDDGSGDGGTTSGRGSGGTEDASASSAASTTSAEGSSAAVDETGSTDTGVSACEPPADPPACEQTECSQRWSYQCPECSTSIEGCFWNDFQCDYPELGCELDAPCPDVFAVGDDDPNVLTAVLDEDAAICVLTALRDGVPGVFRIEWGVMFDCCWTSEQVHGGGDGTVVVEWKTQGFGLDLGGTLGRTGVLPLQPPSYFDECLADPTPAALVDCLVGMVGPALDPPPEDYVPPFTTGECRSLDFSCP